MKLSVAMCTYNGAVYLPAQLASLVAQLRLPDELVICDDCSTDQTRSIIQEFIVTSPIPVRLYVNDINLGSTLSFERAISLCTGDVIALCDQDDVWRNDKLELVEEVFAKNKSAGLVFSDAEIVGENLEPLGHRMWDRVGFDSNQKSLFEKGKALDVLTPGWTVTGATLAFRSTYNSLLLPLPAEIPMIHDGWIALVIAAVADVIPIDKQLVKYRQHSAQQVGAPPQPTSQKQTSMLKAIDDDLNRPTSFVGLRIILNTLRKRLVANEERFPVRESLSYIDSYLRHLDARENLPAGRLRRVPSIFRELMGRSYHRYSNGFYSAAKDLVT